MIKRRRASRKSGRLKAPESSESGEPERAEIKVDYMIRKMTYLYFFKKD